MSQIDTNVNNYTIQELLAILDLTKNQEEFEKKTNEYILKFKKENNKTMETFFQDIQDKLSDYMNGDQQDVEQKLNDESRDWYENEDLAQTDTQQANKITERKQKIGVYSNDHLPMKRQELGVSNNFNVDVAQDVLNPNLKNITQRFLNLDSQYRQTGEVATDYTLDLSDHLTDVLSLRLYSFQIPYTWYIIDNAYGNTCFWITDPTSSINVSISIEPGNYNSDTLVIALNNSVFNAGFNNASAFTYNSINGKMTFSLFGSIYTNPTTSYTYTVSTDTIVLFFDYTATLKCYQNCLSQGFYIDQTLGWIMGFRLPYENVKTGGNPAIAVLNLNGPKYLILALDDYNQNHVNNGLVTITEISKTLKMPSYYSPDLPYVCIRDPTTKTNNLQANISSVATNDQAGEILLEKLDVNFNTTQVVLPSAPRTLTQSQLYTINQIIKNNDRNTNYRTRAPTTTDVFALLPIKAGQKFGSMFTELSGQFQDFKRTYFGPVGIDRLRIKLFDDKGNLLNLNGNEWSVTMISENLYQY